MSPVKTNGYSNEGRLRRLEERRQKAAALLEVRAERTWQEQLALLERRPGVAQRERSRLFANIDREVARRLRPVEQEERP